MLALSLLCLAATPALAGSHGGGHGGHQGLTIDNSNSGNQIKYYGGGSSGPIINPVFPLGFNAFNAYNSGHTTTQIQFDPMNLDPEVMIDPENFSLQVSTISTVLDVGNRNSFEYKFHLDFSSEANSTNYYAYPYPP